MNSVHFRPPFVPHCQASRDAPLSGGGVSCLAPPLRSGAKQLGASPPSRVYVVQPGPAWCLRYAGTKLALVCSGTSSHGAVLAIESEQWLGRRSCIQISQRIGSAANPSAQPDDNRKQRGCRRLASRALADINAMNPFDLHNTPIIRALREGVQLAVPSAWFRRKGYRDRVSL